MIPIGRRASIAMLMSTSLAGSRANASNFPDRPIKLIVPYPPGGGSDTIARLVAQKLSEAWGQPVVIDNKPGADTQIGAEALAQAKPDGYTLGVFAPPLVINRHVNPTPRYDLFKDLRPIAGLLSQAAALVVRSDFEAKTLSEFITLVRANPDKYSYSSTSVTIFLATQLFAQRVGLQARHIPYKGASQAVWAIQAGEVTFTIDGLANVMPLVNSSKLRVLGVSTRKRLPEMPDVPTLSDAAPNYEFAGWTLMFTPRGVPDDIVTKINAEVSKSLVMPDIVSKLAALSSTTLLLTPDESEAMLKAEFEKFGSIIKHTDMTQRN